MELTMQELDSIHGNILKAEVAGTVEDGLDSQIKQDAHSSDIMFSFRQNFKLDSSQTYVVHREKETGSKNATRDSSPIPILANDATELKNKSKSVIRREKQNTAHLFSEKSVETNSVKTRSPVSDSDDSSDSLTKPNTRKFSEDIYCFTEINA